MSYKWLIGFFFWICCLWVVPGPQQALAEETGDSVIVEKPVSTSDAHMMLKSLVAVQQNLRDRLAEKKSQLAETESEAQKNQIQDDITRLDKQLLEARNDFERIATGVDIGLFDKKKEEPFDWKEEVLSLVKPGVVELKRLTIKSRQKTKIKEEITYYNALLPVASEASHNISVLLDEIKDGTTQKRLMTLKREWDNVSNRLENRLKIAQMRLNNIQKDEKPLVETASESMKQFFRTRGLTLLIAVFACFIIIIVSRYMYRLMEKHFPGFNVEHRAFHIRAIDLTFRVASVLAVIFAIIIVFYMVEDWVLLSLAVLFLLSIAWALKNTIPEFINQAKLMMNAGSVREGERIIHHGVPWLVKKINIFSLVENPDLAIRLRLPIKEIAEHTSRPVRQGEPWFPCKKDDWVILSDETRGEVRSLSHEMVVLVTRGGARKVYQTGDFLGMSPLNLSEGFRLKVPFGVSYDLQALVTTMIPETLTAYIRQKLEEEGHSNALRNLRVEFASAGESSLDFTGDLAPLYNRIKRSVQRWCVDACTDNNWEIPFPQLTVHQPETLKAQ